MLKNPPRKAQQIDGEEQAMPLLQLLEFSKAVGSLVLGGFIVSIKLQLNL